MEVALASIDAIPIGEGRAFRVGGSHLAVFRDRDGRVFATQAECPHRGGPLADGLLGDSTLICPLHSFKFDLTTGATKDGDCRLKTYPARQDTHGIIFVDVDGDG
jgi:nitrite reductase (NADH) small subunit